MVIHLSGFAKIITFSTSAPMVSVLADIARYVTSSFIGRNVRTCVMSFSAKKSVALKIVYNKKKIQIFETNMAFILSRVK